MNFINIFNILKNIFIDRCFISKLKSYPTAWYFEDCTIFIIDANFTSRGFFKALF